MYLRLHPHNLLLGFTVFAISILAELDPRSLLKLGKEIEEIFLYSKPYDGNKLLRKVKKYNEYLDTVKQNVEDETVLGNKLYKVLERELGPPQLEAKLYNVLMTRMFNITFDEVDVVEGDVKKTRQKWLEIQAIVNNRSFKL